MSQLDRVRIVVLGDSGVGKTSLVHLVANEKPLRQISYTIGAAVEVKLHEYKEGTHNQKTYWIELLDVGGFQSHRNTRHVFYTNTHGVILVHDLSNSKSQDNLRNWLREYLDRETGSSKLRETNWDNLGEPAGSPLSHTEKQEPIDVNIPILVIGTKQDLSAEGGSLPTHQKRSVIAEEYMTEELHVNCNDPRSLAPGSSAANKLSRFFDRVIEKQSTLKSTNGNNGHRSGSFGQKDRRRVY